MTKDLQRFNMDKAKPVRSTRPMNYRLNSSQCFKSRKDKVDMEKVSYALVVGSLMYAMVCTRPDIAFVVGLVNRYTSNLGKKYWVAVKWILRYLKGTLSVHALGTTLGNPSLKVSHILICWVMLILADPH